MIRKALKKDYPEILGLNQKDVEMLSPLDDDLLSRMDNLSEVFNVIEIEDKVVGFILAFKNGCEYWSDNYAWFNGRYSNFIYVDRIVIDEDYRNRGFAQMIYEDIFEYAMKHGNEMVCAEIDIEPEYNYPSIAFHEKMGFEEMGTRISKQEVMVSLQIRKIQVI